MNKVIDNTYIKPDKLKDRYLYRIKARNARFGIWIAEDGKFIISRFKCDENYLFEEIHWDVSEDFGTAKPLQEIEKCPFDKVGQMEESEHRIQYVQHEEILNYLNSKEQEYKSNNE